MVMREKIAPPLQICPYRAQIVTNDFDENDAAQEKNRGQGAVLCHEDLRVLWRQLVQEHGVAAVFHDGYIRHEEDFVRFATAPENWFYVVFNACPNRPQPPHAPQNMLAFFWLNGFSGRVALIHFGMLKKGLPYADAIGRAGLHFLLHGNTPPHPPHAVSSFAASCASSFVPPARSVPAAPLDAVLGITPTTHTLALRYITRLGFTPLAVLPNAIEHADGSYQSARLSIYSASSGT